MPDPLTLQHMRARIGRESRTKGATHPDTIAAKAAYREAMITSAVERELAKSGPLSPETVSRLTALLNDAAA